MKAYFNTLNEARQWAREQKENGYILKPTITVLTVPVDAQLEAHVDYHDYRTNWAFLAFKAGFEIGNKDIKL